jgi:hypothetical protein
MADRKAGADRHCSLQIPTDLLFDFDSPVFGCRRGQFSNGLMLIARLPRAGAIG